MPPAPAARSAATAASRRLAVISVLNRETTTAKRNGEASPSGARDYSGLPTVSAP